VVVAFNPLLQQVNRKPFLLSCYEWMFCLSMVFRDAMLPSILKPSPLKPSRLRPSRELLAAAWSLCCSRRDFPRRLFSTEYGP
jgi:hypothetical protein